MKNTKLQLMIHEKDADKILQLINWWSGHHTPDLKIIKVNKVENRRYLFFDLQNFAQCQTCKL